MPTIGLKATFTATDKVTSTVLRMQAAVIGFTKSAGAGLAKLDALNSKIAGGVKSAGLALGAVGVGVGLVAKDIIGAGADFEQAITNVGAVSLMTRDQIKPLEKMALQLGATTKFSATEVANAMEMMGKAGFDNAQIMQGVGGILSAAAADGAELADTASNISNVLKGMGLETDQTARVADVLTLASARTNSSISSLGESMANVSSTARQLGVPLEDTVSMVALLQDVGLDASEAGSAVATMLTKLSAPSKDAAAQMKAMGVSFQDAKGNMLAPTKVLEQLAKAGNKAGGNMKQVAFFAELTGMRGQKAALNLQELFKKKKFQDLTEELKGAAGSAEKMAGIRMDTLLGDWETFGGSVDSLKIKLFDMQGGPLRGVVQRMTEWIDNNSDLITSGVTEFIEKAIPLIENFGDGLKSAFQDAWPMIKGVGSMLGKLFGADAENGRMAAFQWGEAIGKWTIRWIEFTAAVKVARVGMFLFGNAMKIARGITIAYNATMGFIRGTIALYNAVAVVGTANTVAFGGAMTASTTGAAAMTAGVEATTVSLGGMALAAGAAMAAIAALYAAYDQNEKLKKETGGKGIWDVATDLASGMSLKESADENLDAQAKQRRREQDAKDLAAAAAARTPAQAAAYARAGAALDSFGMPRQGDYGYLAPAAGQTAPAATPAAIPPSQQGPTPEELKAIVAQELTVKLVTDAGTSAEVVKKPAGAKVQLQPSGGFFD